MTFLLISHFSATCCQRNSCLQNKIGDDEIFFWSSLIFLQHLLISHFSATCQRNTCSQNKMMMMTIFAHHSFFLQLLLISYFSATCCQRNLLSNKIGDDEIFLLIPHFFLQLLLIAHVFFYLLSAQLALKIGGDLFNHFYFVPYIFTFVSWGP